MYHYGMQPILISLLEDLYKRTESAVIVGNGITDWFNQTVEVRQGCITSPDLFNLYLEHIMRTNFKYLGANIAAKSDCLQILVFEMAALRKILGISRLVKVRNEVIRAQRKCNKTLLQVIYE